MTFWKCRHICVFRIPTISWIIVAITCIVRNRTPPQKSGHKIETECIVGAVLRFELKESLRSFFSFDFAVFGESFFFPVS